MSTKEAKEYILTPEMKELVLRGGYIPCSQLHEGACIVSALVRLSKVLKKASKFYLPVHLIPFLIFKRKKMMRQPVKTLSYSILNYIKSLLFVGFYVSTCKYLICLLSRLTKSHNGINATISASLSTIFLLLEQEGRRQEISLFIVPKYFEALYKILRKRNYVPIVPNWELLVFGLAMAILNYYYQHETDAIKSTYLSIFRRCWGID